MVKHYDDLITSKIIKNNDYCYVSPEFGQSNTDQSYYEPMASMVQNAQKSGSVSSSLHNDAEKTISEIRANSDFLPNNMTQEEIQARIVQQTENAENAISSVKQKLEQIKDEVNLRQEVVQKSSESE